MNNLSSYSGLVDAKVRASDKDLPVKAKEYQERGWRALLERCATF